MENNLIGPNEEWIQKIMISCVPLWKYDGSTLIANASGCLIEYANSRFIISIAHASIAESKWQFEQKTLDRDENGNLGMKLVCVDMNSLRQFELLEDKSDFTEPKIVDFTYHKIPNDMKSILVFGDTSRGYLYQMERTIFQPDFSARPKKDAKYGFSGYVRFEGIQNDRIICDNTLESELSYVGSDGDYHIFKLPHKYGSHDNYKGCSGAPIIDEEGNVVALVSFGRRSTDCIYGINISRYKAALEIESNPNFPIK